MALRIHLYNSLLGPLVVDKADPIGINELTQITKRSEDHEGIIYEIILDMAFIKEARAYIKQAKETSGGVDAEVNVTVYDRNPNRRRWEHYATGKINFNRYLLDEEKVVVNIEQTGIERRILNLMDTDVDLEGLFSENGSPLPAIALHDPVFHSKAILKEMRLTPQENTEDPNLGNEYFQNDIGTHHIEQEFIPFIRKTHNLDKLNYGQLGADNEKVNELDGSVPQSYGYIAIPVGVNGPNAGNVGQYTTALLNSNAMNKRSPVYVAAEQGTMDHTSKLTYRHKVVAHNTGGDIDAPGTSGAMGFVEVLAWFEHRRSDNTVVSLDNVGQWLGSRTSGTTWESLMSSLNFTKGNISVEIGDKFYIYETLRIFGAYSKPDSGTDTDLAHDVFIQSNPKETFVSFKSKTISPSSKVRTALWFEAIKRCCEFYTNTQDCFYSDLLGRVDLGYAVDGKAGLLGLTSGNKLRNNGKKLITTLKDLLGFLNARYCIGFGFEIINGQWKFRVEELSHFYRKNERILSIGPVYMPEKILDSKRYMNTFIYGYSGKLDIGQINAIDEFNTIRKDSVPIVNTKNKLDVSTKLRASGNQIEFQRRLAGTTKDSKLDDENFVVQMIRDGAGYKTKSNEGFILIENVQFAPSGYNYDLSPGRMREAWKPVIASCLWESFDKVIKFSYGEVNYEMVSQRSDEPFPIRENGNVDVTGVDAYYDPELYKFNGKLTREEAKQIRDNPYGYIEFFDRFGNIFEGFINHNDGIEHDSNKGTATFDLLRVHRQTI